MAKYINPYTDFGLSYIGIKQVAETAEKDGITKGREEGREETMTQAVLGMNENGISSTIIAKSLNIAEARVVEIIEKYTKK